MKKSFRVALAGIVVGFSLICMFMSGVFPFAEYSIPAISGMLLVTIVIEFGYKQAFVAYVAVSILSLIMVANKEAVALFIFFLGYYPIIKGKLESLNNRIIEYSVKIFIFNLAVLSAYFVMINLFDMTELMQEINFAKYGLAVLWLLGNVVFVVYDMALTRAISGYMRFKRNFW